MAREGLRHEMRSALRKAIAENADVNLKGLVIKRNGGEHAVNVTVRRIRKPTSMRDLLIVVFEETALPQKAVRRQKPTGPGTEQSQIIAELERELADTHERLHSTIQEMESSQEEFKTATEELQSANEELQSTNEEMNTAKEELQSVNEELLTVNSELRVKNEQLSASNDDMRNLLNSTSIPTVFLDKDLKIRRFTPQIAGIVNLVPTDIGRPITDFATNLQQEDLAQDIKAVLETLVSKEAQVQTRDQYRYLMRIIPYKTLENYIDGVVITFADITGTWNLEMERKAREYAESVVATVREPLLVLDADLHIVSASRSFYQTFLVNPAETEGKLVYELGNGQWDIPALRQLLEDVLPKNSEFQGFRVEYDFPAIGHRAMLLNARRIYAETDRPQMILLAIEDITERA
jgi:two-component system CheB/CheR fusion protein